MTEISDLDYEIQQLKLFQRMVEKGRYAGSSCPHSSRLIGCITHRLRPTYYSPSSRTALAESELEYKDGFKSRSVYVGYPVEESDMSSKLKDTWRQACQATGETSLKLAIWTTTVWSLPGNAVSS